MSGSIELVYRWYFSRNDMGSKKLVAGDDVNVAQEGSFPASQAEA
jgi:hypothetical protein